MNAVTTPERNALTVPAEQAIATLRDSLYAGATIPSVQMVLNYCAAAKLDPFQKPVHIVPMYVEDKATGQKKTRDVVMPGIGLYRTQAARTGEHVGTDEPVFGPMVEMALGGMKITVPEWCTVTVRRQRGNVVACYVAKEYWIENYATAGRDTSKPNTMWAKRPMGQLAKCAEAQALRRGFPEVGDAPTAEEMAGKSFDSDTVIDAGTGEIQQPLTPQRKSEAKPATTEQQADQPAADAGPKHGAEDAPFKEKPATTDAAGTINAGQVKYLTNKIAAAGLEGDAITGFLTKHGVKALDQTITVEQFDAVKAELLGML